MSWKQLCQVLFAGTLGVVSLLVCLVGMSSARRPDSEGPDGSHLYLPLVACSAPSPAGSYFCNEYEYGLIWSSEVITLYVDGTSVYAYNPPYAGVVTGTWVYTPATREVGFTNFRWLTATFYAPDRLWATRYVTGTGFWIALDCLGLQPEP
jgi:hypothetical protein